MLGSSMQIGSPNTLTSTTAIDLLDDILLLLGTDGDIALVNRSTVLNANTALTGVLVGTPVTPAIAANSLIISNITTDGDILIAASDGGNSKAGIYIDGSAPITHIYNLEMSTDAVILDNLALLFGTTLDAVILLNSIGLGANTGFDTSPGGATVLIGTPVSQAIAANSLIISNITANGDIAMYGNLGGNSQQFLMYDTSASDLYLGNGTTPVKINGNAISRYRQIVEAHTADDTLTNAESGSIHTNLGDTGTQTLTLPAAAPSGTTFTFAVMAPYEMRVAISAAAAKFYAYGSITTDDGGADLYLMAQDEGEHLTVTADGNGDWVVINTYGTWSIVQP